MLPLIAPDAGTQELARQSLTGLLDQRAGAGGDRGAGRRRSGRVAARRGGRGTVGEVTLLQARFPGIGADALGLRVHAGILTLYDRAGRIVAADPRTSTPLATLRTRL